MFLAQHLGRHVDRSTHTGSCHPGIFCKEFSKPEVTYFEYPFMDEDVGWFQIAVDNSDLDELLKSLANVLEYDLSLILA